MPPIKNLLSLFILLSTQALCISQVDDQTYLQYKIGYSEAYRRCFIEDTLNNRQFFINDHMEDFKGKLSFRHGFIYSHSGDMKALTTLDGNNILTNCHSIQFHMKDSIISAMECGGRWLFMNFNLDTISYGSNRNDYYQPHLNQALTPACFATYHNRPAQYGFLNQKAQWQIEPRYDYAGPFSNGLAEVYMLGQKGWINEAGQWVFLSEYFQQRIPFIF